MSQPVALITGASRGIGRATAIALAKLGYGLALVARGRADLEETARLANATDALLLPADVTDPTQVRNLIHETITRFGRLDAVVNIAGLAPVRRIEEMTVEEWRAVIDTNLSAVFYVTKYAWPHLRISAAEGRQPAIVNVSSLASRDPFPGFAAYGAAKAGLNIFDLVAAREGQADGIAVHTIAPGAVETEMFRQLMTPAQYPPEKTLAPDEVADVIAQCVTGQLRHTRGEVIYLHKTL
ncbi:MAG: 3-oxoacyl-[acyl-carrier protein] reductase [Phycisphaerales bacterium]|nr:3-oxoacyl-[acyl-carrier protein] reductase [Phycisphaerales bacterium]